MKLRYFIILIFTFFGCGRVYNSSTLDEQLYGSEVSGSQNFQLAQAVILSKCVSCHGAWGSYTEEDYISNGLIEVGLSQDSVLYVRIRGNDSSTSGDMPTNGNTLTSDEVVKIKTWINEI